MFTFCSKRTLCPPKAKRFSLTGVLLLIQDTSLPVAVFVWTVQNYGREDADVTIMFTFQNGEGIADDPSYGHYNEPFTCKGIHSDVNEDSRTNRGTCKLFIAKANKRVIQGNCILFFMTISNYQLYKLKYIGKKNACVAIIVA